MAAQGEAVRTEALENFLAVCNNRAPKAGLGESVNDQWTEVASASAGKGPTLIDMTMLLQSVECKVRFARPAVAVNEERVTIAVRCGPVDDDLA